MTTFVGFGFGPIQAGLFLLEAQRGGAFDRLAVAYRRPDTIARVRAAGGIVAVNVAHEGEIERVRVGPIETFDVNVERDRRALVAALAEAGVVATALSSVSDYVGEGPASPHRLLAAGLAGRVAAGGRAVVYAAENHLRAAAGLEEAVRGELDRRERERLGEDVRFVDTVIAKMSGVVEGESSLAPIAPGEGRAFLVEAFNRILTSRVDLPGLDDPFPAFEQKGDLRPFEEAKLFAHNAAHALLAYLGGALGATTIAEVARAPGVLAFVRAAVVEEAGAALLRRHAGVDDALFTPAGFAASVDDLLARMTNPLLLDTVARVGRDPARKLGWDDRLIGTLRLVLAEGLKPRRLAFGVAAALDALGALDGYIRMLDGVWREDDPDRAERSRVLTQIASGVEAYRRWRAAGGPDPARFFSRPS